MPGRPTLADVAALAGVTPGAVSLILRGAGRFSEETRRKVKQAAARLRYRPNPILASYKTGKFKGKSASHAVPIALVFVDSTAGKSPEEGPWMHRAAELGYRLHAFNLNDYDNPLRLGDVLYARGVRGILLTQLYGRRELPELGWNRFACVCVPRPFFPVPFDVVRHRLFESTCRCFEEARLRGYERIGFDVQIHRSWGSSHPDDRMRRAAALYCLDQQPRRLRVPIHAARLSETESFVEWVGKQQPEAVISANGSRLRLVREAGHRVPEEMGFAGIHLGPSEIDVAGFIVDSGVERVKAVEVLDHHIRHNLIGPRPDPMEHLVFHGWNEGVTLPSLKKI